MARNAVCPWWAGYTLNWQARRLIHNPQRILAPYIEPGMTVLDIGCGMGYFTIPMAELVGPHGRVIAVDLQKKMLTGMIGNSEKAGMRKWIQPHLCKTSSLGLEAFTGQVDVALAFMMVHEVPDKQRLIREIREVLRNGGRLLFAEPIGHVSKGAYAESLRHFERYGFRIAGKPKIAFCRSALLEKA